jgi:hypothetical protein
MSEYYLLLIRFGFSFPIHILSYTHIQSNRGGDFFPNLRVLLEYILDKSYVYFIEFYRISSFSQKNTVNKKNSPF